MRAPMTVVGASARNLIRYALTGVKQKPDKQLFIFPVLLSIDGLQGARPRVAIS
jgi:hypothetical protein